MRFLSGCLAWQLLVASRGVMRLPTTFSVRADLHIYFPPTRTTTPIQICRTLATINKLGLQHSSHVKGALLAKITMRALCGLAMLAAAAEVVRDVAPGGHHGMVLLALHELHEVAEEAAGDGDGATQRVLRSVRLKLSIAFGALVFAGFELVEDLYSLGAHTGVAMIAATHVLKSVTMLRSVNKKGL